MSLLLIHSSWITVFLVTRPPTALRDGTWVIQMLWKFSNDAHIVENEKNMSLESIEVIVENEKRKEMPMDISMYTHAIIIDLDISIYGQPSLELLHSKYPNIRVPRFGISNLQGTSSVGISKYPGPRSELFKYRISGYLSCRSCANLFKGHGFAKNPGSQTCKRRYGFTVPLLFLQTFKYHPNIQVSVGASA